MKTMKPVMPPCAVVRLLDAIPEPTAAFHDAMERALRQTAAMARPRACRMRPARLLIACALTLLLLSATLIACIPAARAEVLSWFGFTSPEDYLAAGPDEREPNEALDAMITTPEPEQSTPAAPHTAPNPAAADAAAAAAPPRQATVTDRGNYGALSERLAAAFDAGTANAYAVEALYDGEAVCMSVMLHGDAALFLLEEYAGGTVTRFVVAPDDADAHYDGPAPDSVASGEIPLCVYPQGACSLTFADGTRISEILEIRLSPDTLSAYTDYESSWWYDLPDAEADARNAAFLAENDVLATVRMYVSDPKAFAALADADGLATARIGLTIKTAPDNREFITVLGLDLGEIPVDIGAYTNSVKAVTASDAPPAVWSGSVLLTGWTDYTTNAWALSLPGFLPSTTGGDYRVYRTLDLSLDGLVISNPRIEITAAGLRNLEVDLYYPEHWTAEEIDLFERCSGFMLRVDASGIESLPPAQRYYNASHYGNVYATSYRFLPHASGEAGRSTWRAKEVDGVRLDELDQLTALTLTPVLFRIPVLLETREPGVHAPVQAVRLDKPGLAVTIPDRRAWTTGSQEATVYPQYALELTVHAKP